MTSTPIEQPCMWSVVGFWWDWTEMNVTTVKGTNADAVKVADYLRANGYSPVGILKGVITYDQHTG